MVTCIVICVSSLVITGGTVLVYVDGGLKPAGAVAAAAAFSFACITLFAYVIANGRSYSMAGKRLTHHWYGWSVKQWDLDCAELRIRSGRISIGKDQLCWLLLDGRAFKILARAIQRAQQVASAERNGPPAEL